MPEFFRDPEILRGLGIVLCLLFVSAFFSGSETALTAASRSRIHAAAQDGNRSADIVSKLLQSRARLIGALLLGNNLVNIGASVLMAGLVAEIFGDSGWSQLIATAVMTVLILVFAEVLPKTYAITHPDRASLTVARPVGWVVTVFAPIVAVVQWVVSGVLRLFGVKSDTSPWTAADEIRGAVDLHHREGGMAKRARDQIISVLDLGDLIIEDVMVHRSNVVTVDGDLPPDQVLKEVLASGHTRMPIWKDDPDNVVGVLHAKDLLKAMSCNDDISSINIGHIGRNAWFVPETTSVARQLRAFQQKREHFAIVVDEYGALQGVITLEDILEEIVGDIQDEYDEELAGLTRHADGTVTVRGDIPVRDINRALDWKLPDDEAVTIAGLVIHESQTIPEEKQTFAYYGYRFEILERRRNQIMSLKVGRTFGPGQRTY
ncbi:MAG: HlyC/CorC family transporter [Hyphomonadaceae bacterium]|nr:HlyC/CorC family transporter [Hyphomonadaceae bacterium]MBC6411975.1 HlyC/CorC family transporter [Hyphomonadaceae bacterium]